MDFGITRISNLTGLDTLGIPVFATVSPALNHGWIPGFVTVSSGKGVTNTHARVSALMKHVERWSARKRPWHPVVTGSYRKLRRVHDVIDPARSVLGELASNGDPQIAVDLVEVARQRPDDFRFRRRLDFALSEASLRTDLHPSTTNAWADVKSMLGEHDAAQDLRTLATPRGSATGRGVERSLSELFDVGVVVDGDADFDVAVEGAGVVDEGADFDGCDVG